MPATIADLDAAIAAHKAKVDTLKTSCDASNAKIIEIAQELTNVIARLLAHIAAGTDVQAQVDQVMAADQAVDTASQTVNDGIAKLQASIDEAKVQQ